MCGSWCGDSKNPSTTSSPSDRISDPKLKTSLPPSPLKHIEHGIILKQLVLKGITSQLITAQVTIFNIYVHILNQYFTLNVERFIKTQTR